MADPCLFNNQRRLRAWEGFPRLIQGAINMNARAGYAFDQNPNRHVLTSYSTFRYRYLNLQILQRLLVSVENFLDLGIHFRAGLFEIRSAAARPIHLAIHVEAVA